MWIAVNKNGEPRLFEMPPRRYHEGPNLASDLVGFNDAVNLGNDEYSFWAVQEFYDSNEINSSKNYGFRFMTDDSKDDKHIWKPYVPDCVKDMTWEDEPVEVDVVLKL